MAFKDWKANSTLFSGVIVRCMFAKGDIERACQAAYKAGERQGRKDAEAACIAGLQLRELAAKCKQST